MRPRQNPIEIFSTFLQLAEDRFSGWVIDRKLRRNMENCLMDRSNTLEENFWALYWYRVWQSEPAFLARGHLSAYLQEACYWATQKTMSNFTKTQYKFSDCFQMAIAEVDKVLKGFNSDLGFSLKNYASVSFRNILIDHLRQRHEVNICTDWALLRKLSQKRLIESLKHAGLTSETISQYRLAWNCFKTIYVPKQSGSTRQLARPDSATWEAIAQLYNSERLVQLKSSVGGECNPKILEKWLKHCAQAARSYLYPSITSLNISRPGEDGKELLDDLPNTPNESLLTEMILEEEDRDRQQKKTKLQAILKEILTKLAPQAQEMLQLYYGQGFTQQQIAEQLGMKQYTVSRRLAKAKESLLKALAQWSQQTHNISLCSRAIKDINAVLEEWLHGYYS